MFAWESPLLICHGDKAARERGTRLEAGRGRFMAAVARPAHMTRPARTLGDAGARASRRRVPVQSNSEEQWRTSTFSKRRPVVSRGAVARAPCGRLSG